MKVSELIEILKTKDQDLLVMVDGYEGGLEDVEQNRVIEGQAYLRAYANGYNYYGSHQERGEFDECWYVEEEKEFREKHPLVNVLILKR